MMKLTKEYWENRYKTNDIGWDTGTITTPLKEYIDQIENKNLKILIPGAGNGYEFDYLVTNGFKNTHVVDISETPVENLRLKNPNFENQIIETDFFEHDNSYDLIIEQTFFCALIPSLRNDYVNKAHKLLKPKVRL